eukprot:909885-Rhodomonas_salina.1
MQHHEPSSSPVMASPLKLDKPKMLRALRHCLPLLASCNGDSEIKFLLDSNNAVQGGEKAIGFALDATFSAASLQKAQSHSLASSTPKPRHQSPSDSETAVLGSDSLVSSPISSPGPSVHFPDFSIYTGGTALERTTATLQQLKVEGPAIHSPDVGAQTSDNALELKTTTQQDSVSRFRRNGKPTTGPPYPPSGPE